MLKISFLVRDVHSVHSAMFCSSRTTNDHFLRKMVIRKVEKPSIFIRQIMAVVHPLLCSNYRIGGKLTHLCFNCLCKMVNENDSQ